MKKEQTALEIIKEIELSREMEIRKLWHMLVYQDLFTHGELELVTNIMGYSVETLNTALNARYGYKNYDEAVKILKMMNIYKDGGWIE